MLAGLPCSGKSSLAYSLIRRGGAHRVAHVCQDELGRNDSEEAWGAATRAAAGGSGGVQLAVLDRCNLRVDDRRLWANLTPGGVGG